MDRYRRKRAMQIYDNVCASSIQETAEQMGISIETVKRNMRRARRFNSFEPEKIKLPKILFFDTETAPLLGFFWGLWKQNIAPLSQLENDWFMICWSAKWMGQRGMLHSSLTSEEILAQDDSRIIKGLWSLFDEADVIIAHNCLKFDRKRVNTRFLINGMTPPSPYRVIDTLVQVKKEFAFSSNRMDYINKVLGLERKRETGGMELWTKCYFGDKESLVTMQLYCDQDVVALEDLYYIIAPWIRANINFGVYTDSEVPICSKCGSTDVVLTDKKYYTNVSRFPMYQCNECKTYSRGRYSELSLEKRKELLTSIAR